MAQRGVLAGSIVVAAALLGASAPWSRVLPACEELPAAQREAGRLAGRCEGRAPIINADPSSARGKRVREVTAPRRPVPDLRGRLFNQRDERLARYVVAIDYRESAQRRDWVIDQVPRPPASLPDGANLRVVLSDGALVRVPDVRGNFARALTLLYRAGLSWSTGEAPAGAVIGQLPAAGTAVRPGTAIALRVAAPGPLALAPESTRPEVTPAPPSAPRPAAPPASTAPSVPRAEPSTPPSAPATSPISMPDLVGTTYDAARERLAGFTVQRVHRAGTEPGGTVIGQTPAAGAALAPGTTVRLVLSDGSLVRVPRVTSFTLNEARQRLANGELRPVIANVASESPSGTVVSQQPAEGAIAARGSAVRINVSSGPAAPATPAAPAAPATVPMPNLVGSTVERLQAQLEGFRIDRSERSAREPVGTILEQNPAPGAPVQRGATVAIVVSSGGRPETIDVANVVGQDAESATRALSEFRLERVAVPSTEPAGRVLEQEPAAGAPVPPGSTVRLRVSDASLVRVPSFAQMTLGQARDAARAAGLAVTLGGGRDDAEARITGQQPAAGAEVKRGSALTVEVENRALPLEVPTAVRDAWTRGTRFVAEQSARNLAIAVVVLVALLALLLLATRRRTSTRSPVVEPVFARTADPIGERGPLPSVDPAPTVAATPDIAPSQPAPAATDATAAIAPRSGQPEPKRAWNRARVAAPTLAQRREQLKPPPKTLPTAEPERAAYSARARLEANREETVARGAAPRGPEIRIAARLDAGETGYQESSTAPAPGELTEETK